MEKHINLVHFLSPILDVTTIVYEKKANKLKTGHKIHEEFFELLEWKNGSSKREYFNFDRRWKCECGYFTPIKYRCHYSEFGPPPALCPRAEMKLKECNKLKILIQFSVLVLKSNAHLYIS